MENREAIPTEVNGYVGAYQKGARKRYPLRGLNERGY